MTEEANPATPGESAQFSIMRIYLKDVSFEVPGAPQVFTDEWKPEINLQLRTEVSQIENNIYEVTLNITVTAQQGEKTGFLVEVQQAGLFEIKYFDETQKQGMLGAYCPNTLFPFAREVISDLVSKGGFPQLLLAPVNFDAMYAQQANQMDAQADDAQVN